MFSVKWWTKQIYTKNDQTTQEWKNRERKIPILRIDGIKSVLLYIYLNIEHPHHTHTQACMRMRVAYYSKHLVLKMRGGY